MCETSYTFFFCLMSLFCATCACIKACDRRGDILFGIDIPETRGMSGIGIVVVGRSNADCMRMLIEIKRNAPSSQVRSLQFELDEL